MGKSSSIFFTFLRNVYVGEGMQMSNFVDKSCLYATNDESTLSL